MIEYLFGVGNGDVSDREKSRVNRIAQKHGAAFVRYRGPEGHGRYWFSGPNRGEPFDSKMAQAVLQEVGEIRIK